MIPGELRCDEDYYLYIEPREETDKISFTMVCEQCGQEWHQHRVTPGYPKMLRHLHDKQCPKLSMGDRMLRAEVKAKEAAANDLDAAAAITAVRTFDPTNALLEDEAEFLKMREQVVKELGPDKPSQRDEYTEKVKILIGDPPGSTSSDNIGIVPSPYQSTTGGYIWSPDDVDIPSGPDPFPEDEEPVHVVPAKKVKPIKPPKGRRVLG